MTVPRVYKTEAIVLKQHKLGEADKILTLYTPRLGKIRAVAKGVRRPKSKLGGHVELLTRSSMMLARGRNLDIVTQSQTIDSFLPLRTDLWRTSCALYLTELTDQFTAEHAENYSVYRLLLNTLRWLGEARDEELLLRYFELHLLDYSGYRPQLQQCLSCKSPLKPVTNFFSVSGGGVLCPDCGNSELIVQTISINALKAMRFLQNNRYPVARRLRVSSSLSQEFERLMRDYIRYRLEREVKSTAFLDLLRQEGYQRNIKETISQKEPD